MPTITNELSNALYRTFAKDGDPTPEEIANLKAIYAKKTPLSIEEKANAVSDLVNGAFESDLQAIVEKLAYDHRTLQQKFFGLVIKLIRRQGAKLAEHDYDARNEATVLIASKLTETLDAEGVGDRLSFI